MSFNFIYLIIESISRTTLLIFHQEPYQSKIARCKNANARAANQSLTYLWDDYQHYLLFSEKQKSGKICPYCQKTFDSYNAIHLHLNFQAPQLATITIKNEYDEFNTTSLNKPLPL